MNTIDWSTYKFRSSFLPNLMTASRSKSDPVSETTKAALRELYIKVVYDREKYDKSNKYTEKGIACEPDSMDLVKTVTGITYFKNKETLENEFITGVPDIIDGKLGKKCIIDIKTSWDIWTYMGASEEKAYKDYYYQLLGYMWLSEAPMAKIMYCLVNTPEELMNDEMYKLSFKVKGLGTDPTIDEKVKRNYIFDDIDPNSRVKIYPLIFSKDDVELLKEKIDHARDYLATLKL